MVVTNRPFTCTERLVHRKIQHHLALGTQLVRIIVLPADQGPNSGSYHTWCVSYTLQFKNITNSPERAHLTSAGYCHTNKHGKVESGRYGRNYFMVHLVNERVSFSFEENKHEYILVSPKMPINIRTYFDLQIDKKPDLGITECGTMISLQLFIFPSNNGSYFAVWTGSESIY